MKRPLYLASLALFLALNFYSAPALAILVAGTASPSSINAASNAPTVKALTWTINRAGAGGVVTVESTQANILLDGISIHTINKTITQTINTNLNNTFFRFSETITVPRSVIARALASGGTLTLRRTFQEVNTAFTIDVDVPIRIGSASTADFSISRLELRFSDGSNSCDAKPGAPLKAIAQIEASGSGLLRGQWQVRKGGSLGAFRTLKTVQTVVTAGSNNRIESPELPAYGSERLDVRLIINSPAIAFTEPLIYCLVSGTPQALRHSDDAARQAPVTSPAPNSTLTDKTVVRWKPMTGAKAYRIEIVTQEDGEPVASQMAKKDSTQSALSPLTLEKLRADERYTVRVVVQ